MEDTTVKKVIAELRQHQGDEKATRRCILSFTRRCLDSGYTIEAVITTLALGPDSVLRRVCYCEPELQRCIGYLKSLTVADLFGGDGEEW
jgi:hypothetical protein